MTQLDNKLIDTVPVAVGKAHLPRRKKMYGTNKKK